jgi:hypothetical protein
MDVQVNNKQQSISTDFLLLDLKHSMTEYPLRFFAEGGTGNFVVEEAFFSSGFPSFDALVPMIKIEILHRSTDRLSIDCYAFNYFRRNKQWGFW